jgi:hypothetical protein
MLQTKVKPLQSLFFAITTLKALKFHLFNETKKTIVWKVIIVIILLYRLTYFDY